MFFKEKEEKSFVKSNLSELKNESQEQNIVEDCGDLDDFIFKDVTPKYVSER